MRKVSLIGPQLKGTYLKTLPMHQYVFMTSQYYTAAFVFIKSLWVTRKRWCKNKLHQQRNEYTRRGQNRVGRLPQGGQSNLWPHSTRFNSTTKWKNCHQPDIQPRILERVLVAGCPTTQPIRIREKILESGNFFSGSWISASVPLDNKWKEIFVD